MGFDGYLLVVLGCAAGVYAQVAAVHMHGFPNTEAEIPRQRNSHSGTVERRKLPGVDILALTVGPAHLVHFAARSGEGQKLGSTPSK